ncbi:MAG: hypothetical protein LBR57_04200 [Alistipes sp.]|jgi:hypothetical protein|nr:hypothetical protein [Alistipes sp.]
MKHIFAKALTALVLLVGATASAAAQGVKLDWPAQTPLPNIPFVEQFVYYSDTGKAGMTTWAEIKAAVADRAISTGKKQALSQAKNPYLRSAPVSLVTPGRVVYKSAAGTLELIYALKDRDAVSGYVYAYLIGFDASGRYIDSILASEALVSSPGDGNLVISNKKLVQYGVGKVTVQTDDGGDTYHDIYNITAQLKFVKE